MLISSTGVKLARLNHRRHRGLSLSNTPIVVGLRLSFCSTTPSRTVAPVSLHDQHSGLFHMVIERLLRPLGNLYLFESKYSYDAFQRKVGMPFGVARVVHNGVAEQEFLPVHLSDDASDLVFLGELRALKGVGVLIDSIAALRDSGSDVSVTIVGNGPEESSFRRKAAQLGVQDRIQFRNAMPARKAFALGRVVVVPSLAESLPYVVLEAAAAGKPVLATNVGGIPEIFGSMAGGLIKPNDHAALAASIENAMRDINEINLRAGELRARIAAEFSVDFMSKTIAAAYLAAMNNRSIGIFRSAAGQSSGAV